MPPMDSISASPSSYDIQNRAVESAFGYLNSIPSVCFTL